MTNHNLKYHKPLQMKRYTFYTLFKDQTSSTKYHHRAKTAKLQHLHLKLSSFLIQLTSHSSPQKLWHGHHNFSDRFPHRQPNFLAAKQRNRRREERIETEQDVKLTAELKSPPFVFNQGTVTFQNCNN